MIPSIRLLVTFAIACKPQSQQRAAPIVHHDAAVAIRDAIETPTHSVDAAPVSSSHLVTWRCIDKPCPWGPSQQNHAAVWGVRAKETKRLGYEVSAHIYLPADEANGTDVSVESGSVTVYAGLPSGEVHRTLSTINGGQSMTITGVSPREVVSVQSDKPFTYRLASTGTTPKPRPLPDAGVKRVPSGPATVVEAIEARWRCNKVPGCYTDPWIGAVINWPEWAARSSNGRLGNVSRSVYSLKGEQLYPYMGAWADGCEVTSEEGVVQVIEWEYGTENWRATFLEPGESHVIQFAKGENGALIEAEDGSVKFRVSLRNCTPQRM